MKYESRIITGGLSGKTIHLPDINSSSIHTIKPERFVMNGIPATASEMNNSKGFPDALSFNRKFGLLIPATNTIIEHELWSIIFNNRQVGGLEGVGIQTTGIQLPKLSIQTDNDLNHFKDVFIAGLNRAIEEAL